MRLIDADRLMDSLRGNVLVGSDNGAANCGKMCPTEGYIQRIPLHLSSMWECKKYQAET